jgi:hypothetical protein
MIRKIFGTCILAGDARNLKVSTMLPKLALPTFEVPSDAGFHKEKIRDTI